MGAHVEPDLDAFEATTLVIVSNWVVPDFDDVAGKVFSRDIYGFD